MTTIGVTFDGSDYSQYVFSADILRDTVAGIGSWEVLLDPIAQYWVGLADFLVGNPVTITINGSLMMEGVIDNTEPRIEGVRTTLWKLSGRDWGYELGERFYTAPKGDYVNLRADDIINQVFTAVGTNITPPAAPFTAPFIDYEWKPRTSLGDGVREIADLVGYDFYVADDDPARTLYFFPQGDNAQHTVVNLEMLNNSLTNNILKLEMGEQIGDSIKNNLLVSAGNLKDHYTDMNAVDWTPGMFTVRSDFYAPFLGIAFSFLDGKASIQVLCNNNNSAVEITLDFAPGLYGYTSLDLSEPCMGEYTYLCHYPIYYPGIGLRRCHLQLTDVNGEQIRFYRSITAGFSRNSDATQTGYDDYWQICNKIPFGEQDIEPALGGLSTKGYWWYFSAHVVDFDWSQVTEIAFNTGSFPIHAGDFFLVDALSIPSLEVISNAQDAASMVLYGQRDKEYYRPDIESQVDLDSVSAALLPTVAYPLEKLSTVATGQVLSNYAGQSLDVEVTDFGIAANTRYRIAQLHHMVRRSSEESDVRGWNFLTEYELLADEYTSFIGGKQYYDSRRFLDSIDPRLGTDNDTRLKQKQRQRGRVNIG